jgi:heme a synthase
MQIENKLAYRIAIIAVLIAFIVVMLGAYTRLKDAGLGCPDWPGCYGQITVPETQQQVLLAVQKFPGEVVEQAKAWPEMVHRYAVSILGLFILISAILVLRKRNLPQQPNGLVLGLIALVIFQGLLGKWTVTMRLLPVVVMSHLLGGMALLSLLWLLVMRLGKFFAHTPDLYNNRLFKPWAIIGLIIVIVQIFLGGWTSSNYAALSCPDFPYCQGHLVPSLDFHNAFHFWMAIGPNYQGGVLNNIARVTINTMHRLGGLITFLYVAWLAVWLLIANKLAVFKNIAAITLVILLIQIVLGILNIVLLLPLPIAVAHNGVAALLLLAMVTLNYGLYVAAKK